MITETLIKQQFTSFEKIPVTIFNKADDACKSVSNEIASLIRSKQQQSAHAVLGLATGSTPLKIYQELVRMHKEEGLSFKNVISFNLDEYYPLPPESLQSYRHFMQENLFKHIDIDPANCHSERFFNRRSKMIKHVKSIVVLAFLALAATSVWADEYADTVNLFKNAGESGTFFAKSRGYAVFPTVGKAGVGVGGAYGKGRVYDQGKYIGDTSVTQVSFGLQLGGQAYSEIIFFEDERITLLESVFANLALEHDLTLARSTAATVARRRRRPRLDGPAG